jgi:hypothetical protein
MIFYFMNMFIYIAFCVYIYTNQYISLKTKSQFSCFVWLLQFGLLAALRADTVGTDLPTYKDGFLEFVVGSERITSRSWEVGYVFLNKIIASIGGSFNLLMALCSMLTLAMVVYNIYHISSEPCFCLFLYSTLVYYYAGFNMIRQSLAMAICLFAYKYLLKRSFIKYILIILIASMFHYSALILLPLYFIVKIEITPKSLIVLVPLWLLGLYGAIRLLYVFEPFMGKYASYLTNLAYMQGRSIKNLALPMAIFLASYIFRKQLYQINSYNKFLISISFFSLVVSSVQLKVGIFERFSLYYNILNIFLLAQIPQCFYGRWQKFFAYIVVGMCAVGYNFYTFYYNFHRVLPYASVLSNLIN